TEISLLLANGKVHQNMYIKSVWITGVRLRLPLLSLSSFENSNTQILMLGNSFQRKLRIVKMGVLHFWM
ncbi:hypothetical protein HN51_069488, partial [Arachis hypogaea]